MKISQVVLINSLLLLGIALFWSAIIANAQIIIQDADSIWNASPEHSSDLINTTTNVTQKMLVGYANSLYSKNLGISANLINVTSNVTQRILIEYANSNYYENLIFPKELINDTTPPVITNISISNITSDSVTIKWETNEIANSYIKYGELSGVYSEIEGNPLFFKNHTVVLSNLSPATTYYFVINCSDQSKNWVESMEYNFTIPGVCNINTGKKFRKIQDAIDDVNTLNGHILEVTKGIYYENVNVTKSITILSKNGANTTIIHAINSTLPVFNITANNVNISGFTIEGTVEEVGGIGLYHIKQCNIFNNKILNNTGAIFSINSTNCKIYNNDILDNEEGGIGLFSSSNITIYNNNISDCGVGIYIGSSSYNNIRENEIVNNELGVYLEGSNNNSIWSNNISDCYGGLYLECSNDSTIYNNLFFYNGLLVYESYQNNISNNFINNKPLVYLEEESNITITNAGQVILVKCNNITVKNQNLSNASVGIELWKTENSFIFNNSFFSNSVDGIAILYSGNNHICNNNISANEYGIELLSSSNNTVSNNIITNSSDHGISLGSSSGNIFTNNIIAGNNNCGIAISGSNNKFGSNLLINNNILSNEDGIWIYESDDNLIIDNSVVNNQFYGIRLEWSNENNVTNNIFNSNKKYGIWIDGDYNHVINNHISENGIYGLYGSSTCIGNIIHHNNFINNSQNAYDEGNNIWDNGYPLGGNYWSDYIGTDSNDDGIGDTPYYISGGDNQDRYPLVPDIWVSPIVINITAKKGDIVQKNITIGNSGRALLKYKIQERALYAGGINPGVVYRYIGGQEWDIISPELGYSVNSLVEYEGSLYAGIRTNEEDEYSKGQVYKYENGEWVLVGDNIDEQVCFLIVYNNNLYAGTDDDNARLYRYNNPNDWTMVIDYQDWSGFRSAYVWNDYLYLGDIAWDKIGRYDGNEFEEIVDLGGSCIWDFEEYNGYLYASAYEGRLHCSLDGNSWETVFSYEENSNYRWALEEFHGWLYSGFDSGNSYYAYLKRYNGISDIEETVWTTSVNYAYEGIISMVSDENYLYYGTGGEATYRKGDGIGRVYRFDGNQVELISGDLGKGIQTLYISSAPPTWVYLSPKSGTLYPGDQKKITIAINTTGLEIGEYSLSLIIKNNDLGENPLAIPINLIVASAENIPPSCSLSATPSLGYAPLTVTFSMDANDEDGYISSWSLDVDNDGIAEYSGSGNPPSTKQHIYQNIGTYTAKLTVTDNDGTVSYDTVVITVSESENHPPNPPTGLRQLAVDETTIPEGGTISDGTIIFKGVVNDPDGDEVRLEIELRQIDETFTGEPTFETISEFVSSGTEVTITRYGLTSANYHWQYRAKDSNGAVSEWMEFGISGNTDFTVFIDSDNDALTDWEEENIYHTDPNNPDTDGDGVNDYKEVKEYETDPNDKDTDDDGIEDNVEINLAETYKPVLALAQGEIFYPTQVENFLNYSKLMWKVPSPDQKVEGPPVHDYSLKNYYSDDYYLDLVFSDGIDADGLEDYSEIWDEILADRKHTNITYVNVNKFKAKVRIESLLPFETCIEGYAIQYWFLYIYNYKFFVHEGDWEHITVFLDVSKRPLAVIYNRHWTIQQCVYWNEVERLGSHPIIYVAEGSHASYPNSGRNLLEGQYADYHWGNGDWLFGENLNTLMIQKQPWIYFKGKWGKYYPVIDVYIGGAPSVLGGSDYFWQPGEELRKSGYVHVFVASPVNLHAIDQYGRHVGINETGGIEVEIPEAEYSGPDAHPQWIRIFNSSLNVTFYTTGIENGTFNMTFERKSAFYCEIYNFTNIPTTNSTIAYLNTSNPSILSIDGNGDGIIENTSLAPIANFTYYPLILVVNQTITFNASNSNDPDGYIVSYEWNFGDETNASGLIVEHNYSNSGIYLVTLKVTDNQNLSSTITALLYVTIPPVANFTYEPINPTTQDIIYFSDLSIDEDGNVTAWYWEFGDGINSTLQNPTHIYTNSETYEITLTVWDDNGASNTTSKIITVTVPPNNPPNTPSKPSGPSSGYTGTSYSYSTSTTDPDGDKIKYYFDWGDGTGSWTTFVNSGQTATKSHLWSNQGTYNIKAKAQDEYGAESDWSIIKTVTITTYVPPPPQNQPPTCSLSTNPISGYAPLNVTFSMEASDTDGTIILWSLDTNNDGTAEYSGSGNPPSTQQYTYQNIGNYTAKLTVTDDDGAISFDTAIITVSKKPNQPPMAKFEYTPKPPIKVGKVLHFVDNSTDIDGEIINWTWNLGNGVILYGNKINYTYNQSGVYNVTLTVRDNDGAIDDYTMTITIKKEKKGIPGFEFAPLIAGIAIVLLLMRKRNKLS